MILCPNCHHQEITGALFCSECGARLMLPQEASTQFLRRDLDDSTQIYRRPVPTTPSQTSALGLEVSLIVPDTAQVIRLVNQTEFTLGRVVEGQPILPDVDLSPYEAYARGVSRLHAALRILGPQVVIEDLGSSNGTKVNGQRILAKSPVILKHGDIVSLGKLKLQVVIGK